MPLTYVYCLVRRARRPALRNPPAPIPGGDSIRLVDVGPHLWAVVSSVPAADYTEDALRRGLQNFEWVGRRAMAHEAVVERFLSATALLPMQLFTLFTSDERLIEFAHRDRRRLDRILSRIEGQFEWGVRLTFDEKAARTEVERAHSRTTRDAARTAVTREPSGSNYLARKRDLLDVSRGQLARARSEANRLYRALTRDATLSRRRTDTEQAAPGSRLLLDAAFLVPGGRAAAFRSALQKHSRGLAGIGVATSLTGPWPPYNFIDSAAGARPRAMR